MPAWRRSTEFDGWGTPPREGAAPSAGWLALPGSRAERCRSGRTARSRNTLGSGPAYARRELLCGRLGRRRTRSAPAIRRCSGPVN